MKSLKALRSSAMKFVYRKNKGVSLVIAMILIPVMMVLVAFMVEPIIQSYRAAAADQKRMLAKAIAENLVEQALYITKDLPTGANASGCLGETGTQGGGENCETEVDYGYGKAIGRWEVIGQPETDEEHTINSQYYVPSLGTGDVGGSYCSSAEPVFDTDSLEAALKNLNLPTDLITDPADWPCNWGKLKEGESVIIPLYSHDENGNVVNPGNINFELRVRAACNPATMTDREDAYRGEICSKERQERYVLAGVSQEGSDPNETIIALWEITGTDGLGNNIYLSGFKNENNSSINSFFDVRAINNYNISGTPNTLRQDSKVKDQNNSNPKLAISSYMDDINKPILRLIVIHSLKEESTNNKVPYLEYQFRTNDPGTGIPPISNSSKIVKVEVMVDGGYTETIEKTIGLPKPVTGFVIQQ